MFFLKKILIDLLFPARCLGCQKANFYLCPACLKQIKLKKNNLKSAFFPIKGLLAGLSYKHPLTKKAIYLLKYSFAYELINPLSQPLLKNLKNFKKEQDIKKVFLIPVPLHKKRLKWRGFNQAHLIAQEISKIDNFVLIDDFLIQAKKKKPQAKIESASKRQENIKEVFQVNPQSSFNPKNKTIFLIDDVVTSGATLKECALLLKQEGVKDIWAAVLARQ